VEVAIKQGKAIATRTYKKQCMGERRLSLTLTVNVWWEMSLRFTEIDASDFDTWRITEKVSLIACIITARSSLIAQTLFWIFFKHRSLKTLSTCLLVVKKSSLYFRLIIIFSIRLKQQEGTRAMHLTQLSFSGRIRLLLDACYIMWNNLV